MNGWSAKRPARKSRRTASSVAMLAVYAEARTIALTGTPDKDWREMRRILEQGAYSGLKGLAEEGGNIPAS